VVSIKHVARHKGDAMNWTDAENRLSISDIEIYHWDAAVVRRWSE
jgi:hypothetical protein